MHLRRILLVALVGTACSNPAGPIDSRSGGSGEPTRPTGSLAFSWTIQVHDDHFGDEFADCARVGATTIAIQLKNRTRATTTALAFPCENSPQSSPSIDPGSYDLSIELHNGVVAIAVINQWDINVEANRQTTAPLAAFIITGKGNLIFSIRATGVSSNCKPGSMNGAGITAMTITLVYVNGGCAPFLFTRASNVLSMAAMDTYQVNCSSPQIASCIESNETLTAISVPAKEYTITINGKIGPSDCWRIVEPLRVLPGQTTNKILDLTRQPRC